MEVNERLVLVSVQQDITHPHISLKNLRGFSYIQSAQFCLKNFVEIVVLVDVLQSVLLAKLSFGVAFDDLVQHEPIEDALSA